MDNGLRLPVMVFDCDGIFHFYFINKSYHAPRKSGSLVFSSAQKTCER